MFNLRSIDVNIGDETAGVQAGATLGELYYRIWEKSRFHGFPPGICPTIGVGGHLSGGGYGNMLRKYGLSVDHIMDAKIVNVNDVVSGILKVNGSLGHSPVTSRLQHAKQTRRQRWCFVIHPIAKLALFVGD